MKLKRQSKILKLFNLTCRTCKAVSRIEKIKFIPWIQSLTLWRSSTIKFNRSNWIAKKSSKPRWNKQKLNCNKRLRIWRMRERKRRLRRHKCKSNLTRLSCKLNAQLRESKFWLRSREHYLKLPSHKRSPLRSNSRRMCMKSAVWLFLDRLIK